MLFKQPNQFFKYLGYFCKEYVAKNFHKSSNLVALFVTTSSFSFTSATLLTYSVLKNRFSGEKVLAKTPKWL